MFKKTKVSYTEAPLGYWEEKSYMLAIPEHEEENPLEGIFDRVETISGVEILEKRDMSDQADGYMKIRYKAEEFEVGFFPTNFHFEDYYVLPTYFFKAEDIEKLKNTKIALTIYMKFNENTKKSFHLQLKLIHAIMPNLLAVMEMPMPVPQIKMPFSHSPSRMDLATSLAYTG